MIIDFHTHIGRDPVFGFEQTSEELLCNINKYNIQKTIVMPFPVMDFVKANTKVSEVIKVNKKKLIGFMCINPASENAIYEIDRCVNDLGLKGLMLDLDAYSMGFVISGISRGANKINALFEKAIDVEIPIIFHSPEVATDASSVIRYQMMDNFLSRYPEITLIADPFWPGIKKLLIKHEKLYVETSGFTGWEIVREIGANKLLFSSNSPRFHPLIALEYITYCRYTETQKEMILGKNAEKIIQNF